MLRFVSSPTHDMNITELREALFNYIISKQRDEPLLIRIEDSDKERNIPGKEDDILATLNLFGIDYIEHHFQSNNLRYHRAMALQLLQDKKAFNCFCTDNENKSFYRGGCDNLPHEEVIDNPNPFRIRLKKPHDAIILNDIIQGKVIFASDEIDSFIIMDTQKLPTHSFASAIDDMLSDISFVIESQEHLHNMVRQIAIQRALGYDRTIDYAYFPSLIDDETTSVKYLLEEGFLPSAINNYLILAGNTTPCDIFSVEEAIKWFDLTSLSKTQVYFDLDKLKEINREHLRALDPKELSRYVGFADDDIGRLAKLFLEEIYTLKELRPKISAIFTTKDIPRVYKDEYEILRRLTIEAPHFDDFNAYQGYLAEYSGLSGDNLIKPLRFLLTGADHGPDMGDVYRYIKNYLKEVVK